MTTFVSLSLMLSALVLSAAASSSSRPDRVDQAYTVINGHNVRLVAGVVPYQCVNGKPRFVLVSALGKNDEKNTGWIIPKGGVKVGERPEEAAVREAMEEAGIEGERQRLIEEKHVIKKQENKMTESKRYMYLLRVTNFVAKTDERWEEAGKRVRNSVSLCCVQHCWETNVNALII